MGCTFWPVHKFVRVLFWLKLLVRVMRNGLGSRIRIVRSSRLVLFWLAVWSEVRCSFGVTQRNFLRWLLMLRDQKSLREEKVYKCGLFSFEKILLEQECILFSIFRCWKLIVYFFVASLSIESFKYITKQMNVRGFLRGSDLFHKLMHIFFFLLVKKCLNN